MCVQRKLLNDMTEHLENEFRWDEYDSRRFGCGKIKSHNKCFTNTALRRHSMFAATDRRSTAPMHNRLHAAQFVASEALCETVGRPDMNETEEMSNMLLLNFLHFNKLPIISDHCNNVCDCAQDFCTAIYVKTQRTYIISVLLPSTNIELDLNFKRAYTILF